MDHTPQSETTKWYLCDLGLGNNFLDMTPMAQAIKEKFGKLASLKCKTCILKDIIKKNEKLQKDLLI